MARHPDEIKVNVRQKSDLKSRHRLWQIKKRIIMVIIMVYYGIDRWPQMTSLVMTLGNLGNIQKKRIENKFVIDIMGWSSGDFVIGSLKYRELPSLKFLFHSVRVHLHSFKTTKMYTQRSCVTMKTINLYGNSTL